MVQIQLVLQRLEDGSDEKAKASDACIHVQGVDQLFRRTSSWNGSRNKDSQIEVEANLWCKALAT